MSLTRAQWEEMWEEVKAIERVLSHFADPTSRAMKIVQSIKDKIQSVVGQLE